MLGYSQFFFSCKLFKGSSQFKGFVDLYSEHSLGYIQENMPQSVDSFPHVQMLIINSVLVSRRFVPKESIAHTRTHGIILYFGL